MDFILSKSSTLSLLYSYHLSTLSDYRYSAPNTYSSSIIKKVLVNQQLGGVINDAGSSLSEDYIDIGNKNLKRLEFKITDERGVVMNLYGIPVQFALLLLSPILLLTNFKISHIKKRKNT